MFPHILALHVEDSTSRTRFMTCHELAETWCSQFRFLYRVQETSVEVISDLYSTNKGCCNWRVKDRGRRTFSDDAAVDMALAIAVWCAHARNRPYAIWAPYAFILELKNGISRRLSRRHSFKRWFYGFEVRNLSETTCSWGLDVYLRR
jgi:hypothetical protein